MTNAAFYVLLSLAGQELHGYAIMREVELQSAGKVRLGPGTLYGVLQRMLEDGWIREHEPPLGADAGERRRFYRITAEGRRELKAEAARLHEMVRLAQSKKVLPAER
jgi:DNA-binding PadR family transcriptional regulator